MSRKQAPPADGGSPPTTTPYGPRPGPGGSGSDDPGDALRNMPTSRPPLQFNDLMFARRYAQTPDQIGQLQAMLDAAGLLTGEYLWGTFDDKTYDAVRRLRQFGASIGVWDLGAALQAYDGASGGGGGGGGGAAQVFIPQVTNPEDIRLALKDASATLRAGGAFDDGTIERLVTAFQAQEVADQRAAFDAEMSAGTVTAPQSAETMVRNIIRNQDPEGVGAREIANRYQDFLAALGSPVTPSKL